ncbi:MAG TPA: rhomboid family intramembrane serine protease, partial [Lysobacter sp.]
FGRVIEREISTVIGPIGFVLFYLSAIVIAILPTYLRHRHDPHYRSLGASGAVSAVLFAFILLRPWAMIYVFVLPMPAIAYAVGYVAYSFWMDRRGGDNINHSAHLSGAIYGVLFMLFMDPGIGADFVQRLLNPTLR